MFIHGRDEEAEELVDDIERQVEESARRPRAQGARAQTIKVREQRERSASSTIAKTVFGAYPRRTIVGLSLFIGQAFLYNAVFFTYALVLTTFYGVNAEPASAATSSRSRSATSSARWCSGGCSTPSGASR